MEDLLERFASRWGLGNCVAAGFYASLIAVAIKWRLAQRIPASV
jgi:hypothetical protein